jgi:hypothetical protein
MRTSVFGFLWTFAIAAAAFDAYFAWQHRAGFEIWELNPLICWMSHAGGFESVIWFKVVTTLFAAALALLCHFRRHWLEIPFTSMVTAIFFCLSIHYMVVLDALNTSGNH